jgi:hypothetical protein
MYMGIVQLGVYNNQSIISFSTTERIVMYREKFAGMYSSWSYSFAQVRYYHTYHKFFKSTKSILKGLIKISSLPTGCNRDPLCTYPSITLHMHRLPNNWLLLDSIQTPIVLLHHLLLNSFLCFCRIAACFSNSKCSSCHHTGIIF